MKNSTSFRRLGTAEPTSFHRLGAAVALIGLLALRAGPAAAADDPRTVVQRTSEQVLAVLADKSIAPDARRARIEQIVLGAVEFDILSRLVLARNWSRFSPEQQREFMEQFKRHLSQTYGRRLDDYRNEKVQITGDRKESNGDWTVQTKILRGGGPSQDISVDYRLRQTNGEWKIIDFIIEQVSLVANFRSQFQDIVSSGGPDKLISLLREKTSKGEEFKKS